MTGKIVSRSHLNVNIRIIVRRDIWALELRRVRSPSVVQVNHPDLCGHIGTSGNQGAGHRGDLWDATGGDANLGLFAVSPLHAAILEPHLHLQNIMSKHELIVSWEYIKC